MKLGHQLNILQTQKLIMTPELRQAINILQLNSIELSQFIQEQLLDNPLLETVDSEDFQAREEAANISNDTPASQETVNDSDKSDIDWQEYFIDKSDHGFQFEPKEEITFENFITKTTTLQEYLEEQLRLLSLKDDDNALAHFVIGNLDHRGYCTFTSSQITQDLGVAEEKLESIIKLIQTLEPDGVGARNLQECLIIQLKKKNKLTPLLEEVIIKHLDDIGQGKLNKVANLLGIGVQELQEMVDQLKTLNPKPGVAFGNNDVRFIVPDIIVEKINGEYIVLVNDVSAPRLTINELYREILTNNKADKLTKTFVERKFHGALWLIKSIEQRRITLYRIANTLVNMQRKFLDNGRKHLVPLSLKDVAQEVGVHESTVCRAIANKFVQTPRGLYELKHFFSAGLETNCGTKVSAQSIKNTIEDLINKEDPQNPHSDQQLSNLLAEQGIKVARRTVAKYREELGLLSAAQRKRY